MPRSLEQQLGIQFENAIEWHLKNYYILNRIMTEKECNRIFKEKGIDHLILGDNFLI